MFSMPGATLDRDFDFIASYLSVDHGPMERVRPVRREFQHFSSTRNPRRASPMRIGQQWSSPWESFAAMSVTFHISLLIM